MNAEDLLDSPDVELRLPADKAFAYVLRTTTAALAARVDFTLDDIEDLKIAVTEALALLLEDASPLVDLTAGFRLGARRLQVELRIPGSEPAPVDESGFAWQVLTALAEDVSCRHEPDHVSLSLTVHSSVAV